MAPSVTGIATDGLGGPVILTDHDAECLVVPDDNLCRFVGDEMDGELAVDDVVVFGEEERSDWDDSFSTSSRNIAAS